MSRLFRDLWHGKVTSKESLYRHFESSAFDPVGEMHLHRITFVRTRPHEKMESFYTTVYPQYLADLMPANRFILTIPLVMRDAHGGFTDFQRRWQKEYTDSLLAVRPRWFLISDPKDTSGIGGVGLASPNAARNLSSSRSYGSTRLCPGYLDWNLDALRTEVIVNCFEFYSLFALAYSRLFF